MGAVLPARHSSCDDAASNQDKVSPCELRASSASLPGNGLGVSLREWLSTKVALLRL